MMPYAPSDGDFKKSTTILDNNNNCSTSMNKFPKHSYSKSNELKNYMENYGKNDAEFRESLRTFYKNLKSESKESFTPKSLAYRSEIQSHLKNDAYHSNSEKNIRYIKTSNGSMVTYVPIKDELDDEIRARAKKQQDASSTGKMKTGVYFRLNKENLPHMYTTSEDDEDDEEAALSNARKIKLRNPDNQAKRNRSIFDDSSLFIPSSSINHRNNDDFSDQ
jgi:hypothetical protein